MSLTDIAWVLTARDNVAVNRLRYLEGTPKDATRWSDTGWAILLTSV